MGRTSVPRALLVLSCLLWVTSAITAPRKRSTSLANNLTVPPPPSKDPFYTAPLGYEKAAPGAVLRVRSVQGLASLIANCSAAYNILYRTTDSNYEPSWAVTTLLAPQTSIANSSTNSSTLASGSALLSYQYPYDSLDLDDSPSYSFYTQSIDSAIPKFLGLGWYVNMPDYEGPLTSFTSGVQSGHATIDSVRAVLKSDFGLSNNTTCALSGYSGGALASEWAAELQVQYAPELKFVGAALGGLPANITSGFEAASGGPYAVLSVLSILGLTSQDTIVREYITSQLKTSGPYNATGFLSALARNLASNVAVYSNQNIFDYFVSGASILQPETPLSALADRDGIMGYHGVPSMPIYVYQAIEDEICLIANTDALIERYCSVGANVLFERNTVGGHVAEAINGAPAAFAFLKAIMDGTYTQTSGCTIQNVTVGPDTSPV